MHHAKVKPTHKRGKKVSKEGKGRGKFMMKAVAGKKGKKKKVL